MYLCVHTHECTNASKFSSIYINIKTELSEVEAMKDFFFFLENFSLLRTIGIFNFPFYFFFYFLISFRV